MIEIAPDFFIPEWEDFASGEVKSLGWELLSWGSTYLGQPDGDTQGERWVYTREQALFILRFYAINSDGRFLYRRAVLERPKGWGKSPLLAAICCTELLGPTRFSGWDANGNPVGRPAPTPLVQIAAISEDQTNNTMDLCGYMLLEGEAMIEYKGIDIGQKKITAPGGRKLQKVTATPRGREGNRPSFIVMDETHLWVPAEKGPELAQTLRRNSAKGGSRTIETTNAHMPGEQSVAEDSYNAYLQMQAGGTYDKALLFDTSEQHVSNIYDPEEAFPALRKVYGDSTTERGGWIDLENNIWPQINDPSEPEMVSRRFFFNEKTEGKSTWLSIQDWNKCHDDDIELLPGEQFSLGFKGALRNGATAIVACRLSDHAIFVLGAWEKPKDALPEWEAPFRAIDTRMRMILGRKECVRLIADGDKWQDVIGRWASEEPEKVEEIWLSNNYAKAAKIYEQFETAVQAGRLKWKDQLLNAHVLSCHADEAPQGRLIRKETRKSTRYISAAQAATLALEAATLAIEEGELNRGGKKRRMYGF